MKTTVFLADRDGLVPHGIGPGRGLLSDGVRPDDRLSDPALNAARTIPRLSALGVRQSVLADLLAAYPVALKAALLAEYAEPNDSSGQSATVDDVNAYSALRKAVPRPGIAGCGVPADSTEVFCGGLGAVPEPDITDVETTDLAGGSNLELTELIGRELLETQSSEHQYRLPIQESDHLYRTLYMNDDESDIPDFLHRNEESIHQS